MKLFNYLHKFPLVSACSAKGTVIPPSPSISEQKRNVEQWASRNKVIMTWDFNKFMQNQRNKDNA